MIYTPVSEPTQPTETNPITLPLHNWEALHQLEKEQESLVLQGTVSSAVAAGTGVFGNPLGFFIFALAYRPLIRLEKLARIIKVMRVLLEEFQDMGILVFPCLQVPEHEPLDLFVIFPEKIHLLISIRSKGDCKIVFNEENETLYTKHKKKRIRKWLPCPLVELSDYHFWLGKNRRTFGITADGHPEISRYQADGSMETDAARAPSRTPVQPNGRDASFSPLQKRDGTRDRGGRGIKLCQGKPCP
jgi:hypothetical protein